jgi:hypothetical protein
MVIPLDRTSGQPQVKMSLFCSISLKFDLWSALLGAPPPLPCASAAALAQCLSLPWNVCFLIRRASSPEAESKEKHGFWDPMPELTINSHYVYIQRRLKQIYHGQPYARVDLNPMPESTLSPGQGLRIWPLDPASPQWTPPHPPYSMFRLTTS